MTAKKSGDTLVQSSRPKANEGGLVRSNIRWVLPLIVFIGACGAGWLFLWQQVRDRVVASTDYQLNPESIEITPLPSWIRTPLKEQVIADAGLDSSLSILDDDFTVRIARAFQLHPWVAKVERVSKRPPAGATADLIYRKPVAMVEVRDNEVYPVDVEGVVLPHEDFTQEDASFKYLLIAEIKTQPLGPVGTYWGDTSVAGAAKVAAALNKHWQKLKLNRVVPAGRFSNMHSQTETDAYEIYTKEHTGIDWGRPPGAEIPGEPPAATKIAWLVEYASKHNGTLDDPAALQRLDVRHSSGLIVAPRAPIQPLPKSQ